MPFREFQKNSRQNVRVASKKYEGFDMIDVRVYARAKNGEWVPTPKGVALNVDQIPVLIESLEWALQQPCTDVEHDPPVEPMPVEEVDDLAIHARTVLLKHGIAVHWDTLEKMVLESPRMQRFTKWQLHYVLATRRDLFKQEEPGCYCAR